MFKKTWNEYPCALCLIIFSNDNIEKDVRYAARSALKNLIKAQDYTFTKEIFNSVLDQASSNLGNPNPECRNNACDIITSIIDGKGLNNTWDLFSKLMMKINDTPPEQLESALTIYNDVINSCKSDFNEVQRERFSFFFFIE